MSRKSFRIPVLAMLTAGTVLYAMANIQRVAIPGAVFNQLQSRLDVSAPCITALGSSFMYIYAVCQLLIGFVIDRFGGVRTIIAGSLVFCAGSILFAFIPNLALLYLARGLTGLGASAFYLSLIYEVLRIFRKNSTLAVSAVILIGYMGGVIANAPFTLAVNHWGLSPVLFALAGMSAAAAVFFMIFGSVLHLSAERSVSLRLEPFLSVLKEPNNRFIFIFSSINWGVYYVVQTVIGKKFLEDLGIFTENQAAWILSCMGIISAFSGFAFALCSRLAGNRRQIFCRIAGTVCFAVMLLEGILILCNVKTVFMGILFLILSMTASISAILIPLLKETNQPRLVPYAVAEMNFCFYAAVAVFGNLTGFLQNLFPPVRHGGILIYSRSSYFCIFLFLLSCAVPAFFCSWKMREPQNKTFPQK